MPTQYDEPDSIKIDAVGLGKRIAAARRDKGYSQEKVYKDLQISNQYLSLIENGKKVPSLAMLVALANELETSTDFLLTGRVNTQEPIKHAKEYMDILTDLKPDERETVIEVARAVKGAIRKKR